MLKLSKLISLCVVAISANSFAVESVGAVNKVVVLGKTSEKGVVKIIEQQPIPESFVDLNVPSKWCEWRDKNSMTFRDPENMVYGFMLKKGTLLSNIEGVVNAFYPRSQGLINRVGMHMVPGTTCLVESSPELLIQKIIEPYFVGSQEVLFSTFSNDFTALFYKNDSEFAKYLVGAKR